MCVETSCKWRQKLFDLWLDRSGLQIGLVVEEGWTIFVEFHCRSLPWFYVRAMIYSEPSLTVEWKCHRDGPGTCISKVPKLFGPISGATIPSISSQRRGSKPPNFAILLVFLILKTCKKISFSKQADCSLTTSFSGPKSSRDFRETGPWTSYFKV